MWRTTGPGLTELERQDSEKRAEKAMASTLFARNDRISPEMGDEDEQDEQDEQGQVIAGWHSAHQILGQLVDSYKHNLNTRSLLYAASASHDQGMPCTWTDLCMWAWCADCVRTQTWICIPGFDLTVR